MVARALLVERDEPWTVRQVMPSYRQLKTCEVLMDIGAAAMTSDEEAYNELFCYTLAHGDPSFIHQHVVG
jgi:hypothetical protein